MLELAVKGKNAGKKLKNNWDDIENTKKNITQIYQELILKIESKNLGYDKKK